MLDPSQISLNAVRAFTVAARHGSILLAADELNVTPGAVSHQVKKLETALGTPLFTRANNSISLTGPGRQFFQDASSAVAMIERSARAMTRLEDELVIRVSISLAVRWLIPALERFKRLQPALRIRVETTHTVDFALGGNCDIGITYRRHREHASSEARDGELLLRDHSRPVLSPALLASSGYRGRADIAKVPALKCTDTNWDWQFWAGEAGLDAAGLTFADEFDTDDVALRAAAAGLGMVLATPMQIEADLKSGALVELPDVRAVEVGGFYLLTGANQSRAVRRFRTWLCEEFAALQG